MKSLFTCLTLLLAQFALSQQTPVSGVVRDSASGQALEGAVVTFVDLGGRDSTRALADGRGRFVIHREAKGDFVLIFSYVGYQTRAYRYPSSMQTDVGAIELAPFVVRMQDIVIESPPIVLKTDTIEYRASAYTVKEDATVEDLFKKMPGIQVGADGSVTAGGQTVTKIKVNGKDFFGSDPKMATKNLPADIVEKVQVIDEKSDQAKFSGFDDGQRTKVINITLKKGVNGGYFARATAGGGTDGRYQASLTANRFNDDQQISVIGNSNNINSNLFSFNTPGLSLGMGGFMSNYMNTMSNTGGSNSFTNMANNGDMGFMSAGGNSNQTGMTTAHSGGVNYVDQWGPKLSVYGSYLYGYGSTTMDQQTAQQYFFPDSTYYRNQNQHTRTIQQNHRFYLNIEYPIDSMNSMKISPVFTYATMNQDNHMDFTSLDAQKVVSGGGIQAYQGSNSSPNLSGTVLFRHRFDRPGRTFSVNVNLGTNTTDEKDDNLTTGQGVVDSLHQQYALHTRTSNNGVRFSYTEPLSKTKSMEAYYLYNNAYSYNDKRTYLVEDTARVFSPQLSNAYTSHFITHQAGLNFRENKKKYNYTLGFGLQPTSLTGGSDLKDTLPATAQSRVNFLPQATFTYNFARTKIFTFRYLTSISQPSITQLQPLADYSNPLFITYGNPDLKPQYTHTFSANYNQFNLGTGKMLFTFLNASVIRHRIVNNTIILTDTGQANRPQNLNGYYNINGLYVFSEPFKHRTWVLTFIGNATYTNDVSLVQNPDHASFASSLPSTGHNWVVFQSATLEYYRKQWLELTAGVNYTGNWTHYAQDTMGTGTFSTWAFTQTGRVDFVKTLSLNYEFRYSLNTGLQQGIGKNIALMNVWLEQRVLKRKGVIRLGVNDLFNSNASISRTSTGTYVQDVQTSVLNRYVMLSFAYKFQKFKGIQKAVKPKDGVMVMPQ
jgi:hypothetical protein